MELTLRSSFLHTLDVKLTASSGRGHRGSPEHKPLLSFCVFMHTIHIRRDLYADLCHRESFLSGSSETLVVLSAHSIPALGM